MLVFVCVGKHACMRGFVCEGGCGQARGCMRYSYTCPCTRVRYSYICSCTRVRYRAGVLPARRHIRELCTSVHARGVAHITKHFLWHPRAFVPTLCMACLCVHDWHMGLREYPLLLSVKAHVQAWMCCSPRGDGNSLDQIS